MRTRKRKQPPAGTALVSPEKVAAPPSTVLAAGTPRVEGYVARLEPLLLGLQRGTAEFCTICAEASGQLTPDEKRELCERLRITEGHFSKCATVGAAQPRFERLKLAEHLPAEKNITLEYSLARLSDDEIEAAVAAKALHPGAKRTDVDTWIKNHKARENPRQPSRPTLGYNTEHYLSVRFVKPVSRSTYERVKRCAKELMGLPGVELRYNYKPTEAQYRRSVAAWAKEVGRHKRRLVRDIVASGLQELLQGKPENKAKAEWLLDKAGLEPEQYEVPGDADDERLRAVLETFKRSSEFDEICRQAAAACKRPPDPQQLGEPTIIPEALTLAAMDVSPGTAPCASPEPAEVEGE